jgi:hypothetical protein
MILFISFLQSIKRIAKIKKEPPYLLFRNIFHVGFAETQVLLKAQHSVVVFLTIN